MTWDASALDFNLNLALVMLSWYIDWIIYFEPNKKDIDEIKFYTKKSSTFWGRGWGFELNLTYNPQFALPLIPRTSKTPFSFCLCFNEAISAKLFILFIWILIQTLLFEANG